MLLTLMCLISGFVASYPLILQKYKYLAKIKNILSPHQSRIGVVSIFVGLWFLFSPTQSVEYWGRLDFVGDLIPSVLAILTGVLLSQDVLGYVNFSKDPEKSLKRKAKVQDFLDTYSVNIGLGTFLFGIIHLIDIVGDGYPFI